MRVFVPAFLWLLGGFLYGAPASPPPAGHRVVERGAPIVWLPGGWFWQGSDAGDEQYALSMCRDRRLDILPGSCPDDMFADELERHRTWVSAYGIDRTEVTNADYRRCVLAGACLPSRLPADEPRFSAPSLPVAGLTWREARAYCRFARGRLPTEAEWERAARGADGRRFPWGHFYNDRLANHGQVGLRPDTVDGFAYAAPVGSFPGGASPYGLLDMAGNVAEWTADFYAPDDLHVSHAVDPHGADQGGLRVIRGGSFRTPAYMTRTTARDAAGEGQARADVGVRCAH